MTRFEDSSQRLRRTLYRNDLRQALRSAVAEAAQENFDARQRFELRRRIKADIEGRLLEHGERGVTAAIVRTWAHEASRKALIKMVDGILEEPSSPEALERSRRLINERLAGMTNMRDEEADARGVGALARQIPAAPSPAFIAKTGAGELDRIDFLAELSRLFRDALALRDFSCEEVSGKLRIKNPRVFDRSITSRLNILGTTIATQKELWDLQRMETFYTAIIDEIAAESPECAARIQMRLSALNIRLGMT
jgi:hypothetical protein